MATRLVFVAAVMVVVAVFATTAFAVTPAGPGVQGFRSDYTLTSNCQACHSAPGMAGAPPKYDDWVGTKHAEAGADGQASRAPESQCAGCHTANYDPTKASPSPSGTAWVYPYVAAGPGNTTSPYPFSEGMVGCSSCHYSQNVAHVAPQAEMANADICGQCHSRYSYSVTAYSVNPTPTPGAPATSLLQTQYAPGYKMVGQPGTPWISAAPLDAVLKYPVPGWAPTPVPSTAATPATPGNANNLMTYWKLDGTDTLWQQKGHDGSAAQYPEWASEGHAESLADLKAIMGSNPPATCLQCHSADYRIAPADDKPTGAEAKYGVTCVGCHTSHEAGTVKGVWDEEFDAQLIGDSRSVCESCHNGSLEATDGKAVAGTTVHHPMQEVMNGTAGIDVPNMPSTHKGKCIQCHMPPTSYSRGSVQLGGNHTFTIIEPEVAAEVSPIPIRTTTPTPSGSPVVTYGTMPYSACSTCHGDTSDPLATYLQDTIDQRQEQTHEWILEADAALLAAAQQMGYGTAAAANTALNTKGSANWNADELNFQKAWTNRSIVEAEGSHGVHNFAYTTAIIEKAIEQAEAVREPLTGITMNMAPAFTGTGPYYTASSLVYGAQLTVYGTVTGGTQPTLYGGQVQLQKQNAGSTVWNVVGTTYLDGEQSNEYMFVLIPMNSANYRVKFLGNDTYQPIQLGWNAGCNVKWSVSIKASASKVKKGKSVTFSGKIGPAMQAVQSGIKAQLQKKSGSTWKNVGTPDVLDSAGAYSIKYKMGKKGKFSFRVKYAADVLHLENWSGTKTVTVK